MRFTLTLGLLFALCVSLLPNVVFADSQPAFKEAANIQNFIQGLTLGFSLTPNQTELQKITYDNFKFDQALLGLDFQGLSKLLPDKQNLGVALIGLSFKSLQTFLGTGDTTSSIYQAVSQVLAVFGDVPTYLSHKQSFEEAQPHLDISTYIWNVVDFTGLPNGYLLSGKTFASAVQALTKYSIQAADE